MDTIYLKPGDEVFWTDPDAGICSRPLVISEIELKEDIVCITDKDGGYLECFSEELS